MPALVILAIGAVVLGVVVYLAAHVINAVVGFLRHFTLLWRFLAGHPLDGKHRTNATFWQHPTKALHPTAEKSWWHWRQGCHRSAMRVGGTLGVLLVSAGFVFEITLMVVLLGTILLAGFGYCALRVYLVARKWNHYRQVERPLHHALTPVLGGPPARLAIERDRSSVALHLPATFIGDAGAKQAIELAVKEKLGLDDPEVKWQLRGRKPSVTFGKRYYPPLLVTLDAVMADINSAKWHECLWGIAARDARVITSVDVDAPMTGLSMGTGKGKSTVARNALAQFLYHGGLGVVLDYKMFSQRWALDLPNVLYAKTPAQIHATLMWLEWEVNRRNKIADASADIDGNVTADVGPPIYVVCEELNATQGKLAKYYRQNLKQKGDPARSPACEALDELLFIGRQVKVFVLLIGQRLSVKAVSGSGGGGDARENIGCYLMCDPSPSTFKMIGWDHALPAAAGHRGRIQVVTATAVRETQGVLVTGQEAQKLALAGEPADWSAWALEVPDVPGIEAFPYVQVTGADVPEMAGPLAAVRSLDVTLPDAVEAGLFGHRRYEAVRKQFQRDSDAPSPTGKQGNANTYNAEALRAYAGK